MEENDNQIEHSKKITGVTFDTEEVVKAIYKYTPLTRSDFDLSVIEKWTELKTKNTPKRRCNHLSFIYNHKLYIFGGRDLNKGKIDDFYYLDMNNYIEEENSWKKLYSQGVVPDALSNCSGDIVNNSFYVFGGENKYNNATNNLYVYNIDDDKWEKRIFTEKDIPSMIGHSCNYYQTQDKFIVFGGFSHGNFSNNIYCYENKHWSKNDFSKDHAPTGRIYHTSNLVNNYLYIYGGESYDGVYLNDMWRYNISESKWDEIRFDGEIPKPRTGHSSIYYRDAIYIFGGKIGNIQERNDLWKFDINKNSFILIHDTLIEQRTYESLENFKKKSVQREKSELSFSKRQTIKEFHHLAGKNIPNDQIAYYEQELLKSPNSKKMKNSLIYKLDTKHDSSNLKKLSTILSKYTTYDMERLRISVVPNPRDGHSAVFYEENMVIFGGDRNKFPFNDLFLFKLN